MKPTLDHFRTAFPTFVSVPIEPTNAPAFLRVLTSVLMSHTESLRTAQTVSRALFSSLLDEPHMSLPPSVRPFRALVDAYLIVADPAAIPARLKDIARACGKARTPASLHRELLHFAKLCRRPVVDWFPHIRTASHAAIVTLRIPIHDAAALRARAAADGVSQSYLLSEILSDYLEATP